MGIEGRVSVKVDFYAAETRGGSGGLREYILPKYGMIKFHGFGDISIFFLENGFSLPAAVPEPLALPLDLGARNGDCEGILPLLLAAECHLYLGMEVAIQGHDDAGVLGGEDEVAARYQRFSWSRELEF